MPSRKTKIERLYRGRSHRKGEGASNPRESGCSRKAKLTIREHRDRSAREADRRSGESY